MRKLAGLGAEPETLYLSLILYWDVSWADWIHLAFLAGQVRVTVGGVALSCCVPCTRDVTQALLA